jgi:hypothetical protein
MAVFRTADLRRHAISIVVIAGAVAAAAWPYVRYVVGASGGGGGHAAPGGAIFPLLAGRLFSAEGLAYFYGAGPVSGALFGALAVVSCLAYPLVWAGLYRAALTVRGAARTRAWTPREHLAAIALAAVAAQIVLDAVTGKFEHPHYQNGTWIAFVLLAWMAVDRAVRGPRVWARVAAAVTVLIAVADAGSVALLLARLHGRGTREVYGPTLANQQAVARGLARYSPASRIDSEVVMWNRFPHTLDTLRELNRSHRADLPVASLQLRYASDDPDSGLVELVEK